MWVDTVLEKNPGIIKYKPILLFFAKTLGLFLGFLLLKFLHRTLIDPSNDFILSSYLRSLNIYVLWADFIIYPAKWILNILGYDTIISERIISIVGYRGIIIHAPCLGFDVFSTFITLIIAYPTKTTTIQKTLFIVLGIFMIHLLNILRITALLIKNRYGYELIINHHDLYNVIIYAFVLIIFYCWIKYYSKPSVDVAKE